MRDGISEREMRTENRRFQWFFSIAIGSWTQGRLPGPEVVPGSMLLPYGFI